MTRLVAAASSLGRAILPDEVADSTTPLLEILASAELVQPCHWPIELAGLILKASRRRRVSETESQELIALAMGYIENATVERSHNASAAIEIALAQHISAYDAAYLDVAIRNNVPLLTADLPLRRAAVALRVPLMDPA